MLRPLSPSVRDSLERATARYQCHVGLAADWLAGRGIDLERAGDFRLGVADGTIPGQERLKGRLAIPYLGPGNIVTDIRFRALDKSEPKMLGLPGVTLRLYNIRALHAAGDAIHITEGETDAVSLASCGFHSVGLPGVKSWKPHHARLFAGFQRVFIWGDGDDAGREFAQKLSRELDTSIVVHMPDGMDCNSLLVRDGPDVIRSMCQ